MIQYMIYIYILYYIYIYIILYIYYTIYMIDDGFLPTENPQLPASKRLTRREAEAPFHGIDLATSVQFHQIP